MALSCEEREQAECFARQYALTQTPVMLEVERSFCGCDYGGTSWTTRDEAERLARRLRLGPGVRLLEVGAGAGWPALYLAKTTGCDATLTEVSLEGLRIATRRAAVERLNAAARVAVADGAALPFPGASFDAVSHSDVLCCLRAKLAVLKGCRRVVRANGTMVFTVISITPGLSASDHERAAAWGPPYLDAEAGYPTLLERAGWNIEERIDLTRSYADSVARLIREYEARAEALRGLMGETEYAECLVRKRGSLAAAENGLHRRELYVTVPARKTSLGAGALAQDHT